MSGKLNHLDLEKSPAKSSAGDGLRNRSNEFLKRYITNKYISLLQASSFKDNSFV
jgi:hypothetical protein